MPNECSRIIEDINPVAFGGYSYRKCGKPVKYKANFIEGTSGKPKEEYLCGTHFKALQKNSARMKKRLNYDNKLEFTEIIKP